MVIVLEISIDGGAFGRFGAGAFGRGTLTVAPALPVDRRIHPVDGGETKHLVKLFRVGKGTPLALVQLLGFLEVGDGQWRFVTHWPHRRLLPGRCQAVVQDFDIASQCTQ